MSHRDEILSARRDRAIERQLLTPAEDIERCQSKAELWQFGKLWATRVADVAELRRICLRKAASLKSR